MREKLETLSVSVLKEFAKDKHIKNISTMRKSELIDAIIAANEAEEADGYKVAPVQEESAKSAGEKEIKTANAAGEERPARREPRTTRYERHSQPAGTVNEGRTSYDNRQQDNRTDYSNRQTEYSQNQQDGEEAEIADGILEVLQEGYGFIRCENFLPGEMMCMLHHPL